jgi:hypothetical protein
MASGPDEVNEFINLPNPSDLTRLLGVQRFYQEEKNSVSVE